MPSNRYARHAAVTLATAIFTSLVAWMSVASPGAQSKSAKDGVYTAAQAERGNAEYGKNCASCHKDDMSGSTEAPALAGEKFIGAWRDRSVGDLYDLVRTTMPYDQPNSLDPRAYADIVASMLQRNNYRAGSEELRTDAEALKNLLLK
jgi:mono/diheme cytochrome c family protein